MIKAGPHSTVTLLLALVGNCLFLAPVMAADRGPHDWLDRMSSAVQTTDYQGTVIRISDGRAEALKIVHSVSDGVIREKVIAQEGNGLEIIRNGNEVHCILPARKSVLVEEWNDQSTLFSTLPSSNMRFGNEYDVKIVAKERVAGRETVELAIKPHDVYRYEHRVWLDVDTGFPLQTQLIDDDGSALEQVKFADISLGRKIKASALKPSYSTENFKWYNQPRRRVTPVVDSVWQSTDLPIGFVLISAQQEVMPGTDEAVTHILYSDGLANVSVFIAAHANKKVSERSRVGASNSYSTVIDSYRITAVGEVPAITVEQVASSMRLR
ncbi:MAG: MucB/RseB C-terminal domain-containing protein [Gammaproteobacteria bacterium]|nr:MucB/RseB C-terminal domain-containing protein [Gammaproteobacteria bacterium]